MPQRMLWQNTKIKRTIRFSEATINQIRQAAPEKRCISTKLSGKLRAALDDSHEAERRIAVATGKIRKRLVVHAPRAANAVRIRRNSREGHC